MVGRKPRKTKRSRLMGSHNRCWLWGRHVVMETLRVGRWPIVELCLSEHLSAEERDAAESLAVDRPIPIRVESTDRLTQLCGASDHQGYLAKMRSFPFLTVDNLVSSMPENSVLCLLDGIQDPHNYGAILRSAEVLGIDGVIVGSSRQSDVTAIVARSSAGAVNHLPLAQTDDLLETARHLHDLHRLHLVAADHYAASVPSEYDWTRPTLLIIGNESTGITDELRSLCDAAVRIPQSGQTESLNAAVAAGILFYEVRCQRT